VDTTPTKWSKDFFDNLFKYNGAYEEPSRAKQWKAKNAPATVPDADKNKNVPTMLTTDLPLALTLPTKKISRRFYEHPDQFADALPARGSDAPRIWPIARIAAAVPRGTPLAAPDPLDHPPIEEQDAVEDPRVRPGFELVSTAWASASTFRGSDKRGGANGARIRFAPQRTGRQSAGPLAKVLVGSKRSRSSTLHVWREKGLAC
jgi:catalase-peroxidase